MRPTGAGPSLFAGAGSGLALASFPGGAATPRAENRYLSFLAEVGYEFNPAPDIVLVAKAHWRNYIWQGLDYSGWSVHFQVGIPIPW
jgi:aromatic ring-opening dioxygenase catalytic subunit (LigB family)